MQLLGARGPGLVSQGAGVLPSAESTFRGRWFWRRCRSSVVTSSIELKPA